MPTHKMDGIDDLAASMPFNTTKGDEYGGGAAPEGASTPRQAILG
jgi:hypothetical protein